MNPHPVTQMISASTSDGLVFERYCYAPGPAGTTHPHVHDTYQLCLSVNFIGQYHLGTMIHPVPTGSVSVIPPGQVHAARDPVDRPHPALFLVAYFPPERVDAVAAETEARTRVDALPSPVSESPWLRADFSQLCDAALGDAPRLELDERLLSVVMNLGRAARGPGGGWSAAGRERRAVREARDYLHAHLSDAVTLADLARISGLSTFRFTRVFHAEVGMPPHAYHLAVRIDHAKHLLMSGMPAVQAAVETGFYDQSHFTRHFRRIVGTSPGRYRPDDKNVQDVRR